MGGALVVATPAFALAKRRASPWLAQAFSLPTRTNIDARLLAGAVLFGLGWGLAGFCPGPALASLGQLTLLGIGSCLLTSLLLLPSLLWALHHGKEDSTKIPSRKR